MNDNQQYWNNSTPNSGWNAYGADGEKTQWVQMPDGSWTQANKPQETSYTPTATPPSFSAGTGAPTQYPQTAYNPGSDNAGWNMTPYNQYPNTPQPYTGGNNTGAIVAGVIGVVFLMIFFGSTFHFFPFFFLFFFLPWIFGRRGRRW